MRSTVRRALTTVFAMTLFGSACGVNTGDESFSVIRPEDDPFDLEATSTTTSTSTTTTTTLPVTPETVPTTTIPALLDPAEFYFLTSRGRLRLFVRELPPPFTADQIADILEAGPEDGYALETLVEEGLIVSSVGSRAVLTVDLDAATFARIPSTQQTEAIGQIVLTMIGSLRPIGLVNFTIKGEPIAVKKGNSLLSDVGEPLAYEDYAILLETAPPTVASTTAPPEATATPPETTLDDQ